MYFFSFKPSSMAVVTILTFGKAFRMEVIPVAELEAARVC